MFTISRAFRAVCVVSLICTVSLAANYYVDPATGDISNDGSSGSPWNTLAAVAGAKTFTGGDTIFLRSGWHGGVSISGTNSSNVVIMAEEGEHPWLNSIRFRTSKYWVLDGVTISPENNPPYAKVSNLAYLDGGATFITVKNCSLYSVKDASDWTSDDWNTLPCGGFRIDSRKNTISNNIVKNFGFGLSTGYNSDSCLIEYNTFDRFAGDGMRGLGDYGVFQYNKVVGCVDVNANHDDAFQSWSYADGSVGKGVVKGIVLRGNYFLNWDDYDQPFRGNLQAVGLFDGFFEDWRIENNLISVSHYHGITLMGATNCMVINNTVISIPQAEVSPLWIQITNHKDGRPSSGNIVRNNLTTDINGLAGTTADHNFEGAAAKVLVNDYNNLDFTPKAGMPYIIDQGSSDGAPSIDFAGTPRPFGGAVDIGCYEWTDGSSISEAAGYKTPLRGAGHFSVTPHPVRLNGTLSLESDRAGLVGMRVYAPDGRLQRVFEYTVGGAGKHALRFDSAGMGDGLAVYMISFDGIVRATGSMVIAR